MAYDLSRAQKSGFKHSFDASASVTAVKDAFCASSADADRRKKTSRDCDLRRRRRENAARFLECARYPDVKSGVDSFLFLEDALLVFANLFDPYFRKHTDAAKEVVSSFRSAFSKPKEGANPWQVLSDRFTAAFLPLYQRKAGINWNSAQTIAFLDLKNALAMLASGKETLQSQAVFRPLMNIYENFAKPGLTRASQRLFAPPYKPNEIDLKLKKTGGRG